MLGFERTFAPLAAAIFALSSLALASCGGGEPGTIEGPVPEDQAASKVAKRLCHTFRKCDCGKMAGVSLDNCGTGLKFAWQSVREDAEENGWTYDGECMTERLNWVVERGCEPADRTVGFGCGEVTCQIYHGDVPEGGECEGGRAGSDCQQGLVCLGTCQLPCTGGAAGPLGEGEQCRDEGELLGTCDVGLLCDTESELCETLPEEGESCPLGQCAEGLWCDTTTTERTCAPQQPAGGECMFAQQCQSFVCEEMSCAPIPGAGDPCATTGIARCADGLACVDGTCAEPPGEGEACLATTTPQCAGDLICGAKLCSADPGAPGCDECDEPPDECIVQVCMPEPPAVCGDSGGLLF